MSVCVSCDQEPEGVCWAYMFAPILDRAGRHGGRCWDGRFPSTDDMAAERKRREKKAQIPVLPSIARARAQLELQL